MKNSKERYSFNAQWLQNKFIQLNVLISEEDPDISTETWFSSDIIDTVYKIIIHF